MALGECSNEFVVRGGSIKSARFVQGSERRKAERECGRSRQKKESPQLGRKNGRANGNALHQEGGQSGVRSDNMRPECAADERARKSGSTAGEGRHRTKPLVPEAVLEERTVLWNC